MELYCGIDLHSNNSVIVILDEVDLVIYQKKLANDLTLIIEQLAVYKDKVTTIAIESAFNWYWLFDGLIEEGLFVPLDLFVRAFYSYESYWGKLSFISSQLAFDETNICASGFSFISVSMVPSLALTLSGFALFLLIIGELNFLQKYLYSPGPDSYLVRFSFRVCFFPVVFEYCINNGIGYFFFRSHIFYILY
jgi:hypothetical protein